MGIFTRTTRTPTAVPVEETPKFAASIDAAVFGLTNWDANPNTGGRVDRAAALTVPAVKRARDIICGSVGTLPLDLLSPEKEHTAWSLFDQPEKYTARSVTLTRTTEDLLFEGLAVWRVTEWQWNSYPKHVKRIPLSRVQIDDVNGVVYIDGKIVPDAELIIFTSANEPLLVAGARAIRTSILLDAAAANSVDGVPPMGILSPADGYSTPTDEEKTAIQDAWRTARKANSTAFLQGATYTPVGWNPEQLQMAQARQHAALEIARLTGVDPEELGVSTTSRTYANQYDRRKAFLDFTQASYRLAIEERLSMRDCSPRGFEARFNLSAFLRSDDLTRMNVYEKALATGALTHEEIRELEDRPVTDAPTVEPVAATAEVREISA